MKVYKISLMIFMLVVMVGCSVSDSKETLNSGGVEIQGSDTSSNENTPVDSFITEDEAKMIALGHAGIAVEDATFLKVSFEYDNGIAQYEVEFYVDNKEYDYSILATTGEIIEFDYDVETSYTNNTTQSNDYITEAKAKEIALAHANFDEVETTYLTVEFEIDDGIAQYEIEWYIGRTEYSYEINATTGAILSYEVDQD